MSKHTVGLLLHFHIPTFSRPTVLINAFESQKLSKGSKDMTRNILTFEIHIDLEHIGFERVLARREKQKACTHCTHKISTCWIIL